MAPDDQNRERSEDSSTRGPEPPVNDDVDPTLDAEEEASAEASQRPGPRGRIGGMPRNQDAAGDPESGPGS